jgi:hypothetical protein
MVWRAWRWISASSLASTITKSEHHWTAVQFWRLGRGTDSHLQHL